MTNRCDKKQLSASADPPIDSCYKTTFTIRSKFVHSTSSFIGSKRFHFLRRAVKQEIAVQGSVTQSGKQFLIDSGRRKLKVSSLLNKKSGLITSRIFCCKKGS